MTRGKRHAIAADIVFDGAALHRDSAVVIEGADIAAVVPRRDLPPGIPLRAMPPGAWLAPGFIDVQVNGGGDVLFNDIRPRTASPRSPPRTAASARPACCRP